MKKFLVADIVKAVESERDKEIARIQLKFGVNEDQATYLYDEYRTDAEREEVINAAQELNADIEDIEDDDIEALNGSGKSGSMNSTVGPIEYFWDVDSKRYYVHMEVKRGGKDNETTDLIYILNGQEMDTWTNADSSGEYYNENIRGNDEFEHPDYSCGCNEDPCSPDQIDQFRARYSSLS